ncbi:MAG: secretion protein HlyD [Flavobacterium sp. BFFFF2]|nr:MAG: secretion protein HlyD [Flavobacterium sp. BFFFF2]
MTTPTKSNRFKYIFLVILILGIGYGSYKYVQSLKHETTDDAQIERYVTPVIPKVSGYLTSIQVTDNQVVKKGDTLFCIDPTDYRIKVQEAISNVEAAKEGLAAARADIGQSVAGVQVSSATRMSVTQTLEGAKSRVWRAENDFKRFDEMYKKHHITKQQWEQAQSTKIEAQSQLKAIEEQVKAAGSQTKAAESRSVVAQKQIQVAQARLKQAEVQLEAAQINLNYTVVRAATDGQVSRIALQPGQWVQTGQTLFQLINNQEVWVVANFKETQLGKMKIGQKVEMTLDAYPGETWIGHIHSFSPATGAKFSILPPDNATGNFVKTVQRLPVKIQLDPSDKQALTALRAGMNVEVDVHLNE